jgi:hypothetical protein
VGAVRVDPQKVPRELTGNVLSAGDLSRSTRNVLFFHGLSERFADDPEAALDTMRKNILAGRTGPDVFPAAAELSFFHAEASGKRSYYLAAAVYAWIFLFPAAPTRACRILSTRVFAWPPISTTEGSRSGSPRPTRP